MLFSLTYGATSRIGRARAVPAMVSGLIFLAALPLQAQGTPPTAETKSPDLDAILGSMEDAEHPNPAQSKPYQVTRDYKVFMGADTKPTSDVMARIDFVPPATETFTITQSKGNPWGERIVRDILVSETASARKEHSSAINRANYDFVFLRQENYAGDPEYVFAIFPKRKDKYLLRGQIWVDKGSFRIRQIQGVPAESPSFWLTGLYITLQYAEVGGQWVLVSVDGLAKVRFLGQFTLTGINIPPPASLSPASN
jgi:hypothetical protein